MVAPAIFPTTTKQSSGVWWRGHPVSPIKSRKETKDKKRVDTIYPPKQTPGVVAPIKPMPDEIKINLVQAASISPLFLHARQHPSISKVIANQKSTRTAPLPQAQMIAQIIRRTVNILSESLKRTRMASEQRELVLDTLGLDRELHKVLSAQENFQSAWNFAGQAIVDFGLTELQGLHFQPVGEEYVLKNKENYVAFA